MEFYRMLRNKSTMNFEYIQVSIIIIFYKTTGVYVHNYLVNGEHYLRTFLPVLDYHNNYTPSDDSS